VRRIEADVLRTNGISTKSAEYLRDLRIRAEIIVASVARPQLTETAP